MEERIGTDGLGETIGIEGYERSSDELATARLPVSPAVMQPFGIVHGGALAALAETICSRATYETVAADGMIAVGQANDTSFLRPISTGDASAVARARHRGRTSWVWEVEVSDDEGRLCALSRVTIAVRPLPGGPAG